MTIQELINHLQYSIDICGFKPDATVVVDSHDTENWSRHPVGDVDYYGTNMNQLPLNVYEDES
jgi:hypothetical protein